MAQQKTIITQVQWSDAEEESLFQYKPPLSMFFLYVNRAMVHPICDIFVSHQHTYIKPVDMDVRVPE